MYPLKNVGSTLGKKREKDNKRIWTNLKAKYLI